MSNRNIYNWPKKFLEASELEDVVNNHNVFVDDYVTEVFKDHLEGLNEEELKIVLKKISNLASFFSRLKTNTENVLGEIILTRLLDEADLEAEGEAIKNGESQFIRIDTPEHFDKLIKEEEEWTENILSEIT